MRIESSGRYEWRKDQYDAAADALGAGSRAKGLDAATELILELLGKPSSPTPGALEEVARILEGHRVPDDVAEEIADALSVGPVGVSYWPASAEAGLETDIRKTADD